MRAGVVGVVASGLVLAAAAAAAATPGRAPSWSIYDVDDPYSSVTQWVASHVALRVGCADSVTWKVKAVQSRSDPGRVLGLVSVTFDNVDTDARRISLAVRGYGPLESVGGDFGGVNCWTWRCEADLIGNFALPAEAIERALEDGVLSLRARTSLGPRCDAEIDVSPEVLEKLGLAPSSKTSL